MSILPPDPVLRQRYYLVRRRVYATIHEYAHDLIMLVHHYDENNRPWGYDYGFIHKLILEKFPCVTFGGPHMGRPTKMPFKELVEIACELNQSGVRVPNRPRRRAKDQGKNKKKSGGDKA